MLKILAFPNRYVQGPGIVELLSDFCTVFGSRPILIVDAKAFKAAGKELKKGLNSFEKIEIYEFHGEVTKIKVENISRKIIDGNSIDFVIGFGGGKTLDLAKSVAHRSKLPNVMVPTSVATNAACSAIAVMYTENGVLDEVFRFTEHPGLVFVDTRIIAEAPIRLFVSGMGDALAAKFEAEACAASKAQTPSGGLTGLSALAWANSCYATLMEQGAIAKIAVEKKTATKPLENVIEAILIQSAIGFESGGTALAHAVTNAITNTKKDHKYLHGEKVAFGTIVQLIIENRPIREIKDVIAFCRSVGLPTKLADIGLEAEDDHMLRQVAEAACMEKNTANMPFEVDSIAIFNGLRSTEFF